MTRLTLSLCLALHALTASAAFKCVDDKGKSHYEDIPPEACRNVVIYEVSPSGTVVRKLDPTHPPTPEAKKAEPDRATIDRERRDRTLLDTFANEREIDTARNRSLDLIKSRKETAEVRLGHVRKRRQQIESGPATGRADLQSVVAEQQSLEHAIAGYDAEIERVSRQFETDKKRWNELREKSGAR